VSQNARTAFQRLLYSCFLKSCLFTAASYSCFFTAASSQLAGLESPSLSLALQENNTRSPAPFCQPSRLDSPALLFFETAFDWDFNDPYSVHHLRLRAGSTGLWT
jgi:hypothetical protein